jgi:hypothetical protein
MVRPERQALPLRKLDEVWNIATTREALERQNSLFDLLGDCCRRAERASASARES